MEAAPEAAELLVPVPLERRELAVVRVAEAHPAPEGLPGREVPLGLVVPPGLVVPEELLEQGFLWTRERFLRKSSAS